MAEGPDDLFEIADGVHTVVEIVEVFGEGVSVASAAFGAVFVAAGGPDVNLNGKRRLFYAECDLDHQGHAYFGPVWDDMVLAMGDDYRHQDQWGSNHQCGIVQAIPQR